MQRGPHGSTSLVHGSDCPLELFSVQAPPPCRRPLKAQSNHRNLFHGSDHGAGGHWSRARVFQDQTHSGSPPRRALYVVDPTCPTACPKHCHGNPSRSASKRRRFEDAKIRLRLQIANNVAEQKKALEMQIRQLPPFVLCGAACFVDRLQAKKNPERC